MRHGTADHGRCRGQEAAVVSVSPSAQNLCGNAPRARNPAGVTPERWSRAPALPVASPEGLHLGKGPPTSLASFSAWS